MKRRTLIATLIALTLSLSGCKNTQYGGYAPVTVTITAEAPEGAQVRIYLLSPEDWIEAEGEENLAALRTTLATVQEASAPKGEPAPPEALRWLAPYDRGLAPVTDILEPRTYHCIAIRGTTLRTFRFNAAEYDQKKLTLNLN